MKRSHARALGRRAVWRDNWTMLKISIFTAENYDLASGEMISRVCAAVWRPHSKRARSPLGGLSTLD